MKYPGSVIGIIFAIIFIFIFKGKLPYAEFWAASIPAYGFRFDTTFWKKRNTTFTALATDQRMSFIVAFFYVYGHYTKLDGHSSESEQAVADKFILMLLLTDSEKDAAQRALQDGRYEQEQFKVRLARFKKKFKGYKALREYFLHLLGEAMTLGDDRSTSSAYFLKVVSQRIGAK